MPGPATVDEYLAPLPEAPRAALEALRATIRAAAPRATELISYNMPAFREGGRFLVSYAAYSDHCSILASAAVREALRYELEGHFSGKGTIRFDVNAPLSDDVVTKIVQIRLAEVAAERR